MPTNFGLFWRFEGFDSPASFDSCRLLHGVTSASSVTSARSWCDLRLRPQAYGMTGPDLSWFEVRSKYFYKFWIFNSLLLKSYYLDAAPMLEQHPSL
jgi:hypothetical protein